MSINLKALQILSGHLGEKETAPNQGPIVDWAIHNWTNKAVDESGWAKWCAGAVCTAYLEAGSSIIKSIGSLSVNTLFNRLSKLNLCYANQLARNIEQGDLVFFRKSNSAETTLVHVGLVYSIGKTDILVIEGNSHNSVRINSYPINDDRIYSYAYIT